MQTAVVILIVVACAAWLGVMVYRYLRPRPGGKACGGGCCDGVEKNVALQGPGEGAAGERTMMISADDLRARIAARRK